MCIINFTKRKEWNQAVAKLHSRWSGS